MSSPSVPQSQASATPEEGALPLSTREIALQRVKALLEKQRKAHPPAATLALIARLNAELKQREPRVSAETLEALRQDSRRVKALSLELDALIASL